MQISDSEETTNSPEKPIIEIRREKLRNTEEIMRQADQVLHKIVEENENDFITKNKILPTEQTEVKNSLEEFNVLLDKQLNESFIFIFKRKLTKGEVKTIAKHYHKLEEVSVNFNIPFQDVIMLFMRTEMKIENLEHVLFILSKVEKNKLIALTSESLS